MTTKDMLVKYREILDKLGANAATEYLERNRLADPRFASVADFHRSLMQAFDNLIAQQ